MRTFLARQKPTTKVAGISMPQYDDASFAQDVRNSAYQLPALVQQYLHRARALRLESVKEVEQERKARLIRGVQWFIASMAYAIRPQTYGQSSVDLTRVLMADDSLKAIMDTVEEGAFEPDDWFSMFALLTDELSCKDYGALALDIFEPFVGWSLLLTFDIAQRSDVLDRLDCRPPAVVSAVTPTLTAAAESIEPPPLFLPSPGIPESSSITPLKLKRARTVSLSTAEDQDLKRIKIDDESAETSPDVPNVTIVPATPTFISTETISDGVSQVSDALGPAIALAPAVWRVSSSSPLASHVSRFPSPNHSVSRTHSAPAPSRPSTPSSKNKERKSAVSRSKFTPTRSSGSGSGSGSGAVRVDNAAGVTCGKGSLGKSVVTARHDVVRKTGPKFVPSRTRVSSAGSIPLDEAAISSKSDSGSKPVAPSKSDSSGKPMASSKSDSSGQPMASSKSDSSAKSMASSGSDSSSKSASASKSVQASKSTDRNKSSISSVSISNVPALSSKSVNTEKFVPSRRESITNLSKNVPRTPQPNCLNLQRRLVVLSPPPKQLKPTYRT
ncbi:hypothetical protein C0992_007379 [Termitomyces sp. T32_za158]|nr:hypothetical protein C0992_007379 [Termitomyces sp. T32_za158]